MKEGPCRCGLGNSAGVRVSVRLRLIGKLHIYKQKGVSRTTSRARTPTPTDLPTSVKPESPPHSAYK